MILLIHVRIPRHAYVSIALEIQSKMGHSCFISRIEQIIIIILVAIAVMNTGRPSEHDGKDNISIDSSSLANTFLAS